jgi:hypothetical protein
MHHGTEIFMKKGRTDGELAYSALYAGPMVSYAADRFRADAPLMQLIGEMRPRARITEADSAVILRYLLAGIRRGDSG